MQTFEFQSPRSSLVGPGSSARVGELAAGLGCRSVLLVTDKGVEQAGLLGPALQGLDASGIAVTIYTDVQADPPEAVIAAATAAARRADADGIIGLGGGSSMDVAKLVALLAVGKESLASVYGVGQAKGPRLPLILLPTTAGTGSEVTPISIVTTGEGEKKGVVTPVIVPDWAVLDADLTLGLPPLVTAATGVDAIVHAIEAYTSKRLKNPVSDCLAREALRLLCGNIHEACRNGSNREARHNMLLGAMLAGMAFANAPVAGVHALAYPVGARFHVPHGLSNSLVLPAVLQFNARQAQGLYAELADIVVPGAFGSAREKCQALVDKLAQLPAELGLQTRLSQVGIQQSDLQQLAVDAMKQTRLLVNNPREIGYDDALAIYEVVL
ncbi:iron-containing alcohol dehydrogenase [Janthinobacterium sp. 17J80-10]|uniref:iron-containing alcohol dehydrogenase n=1 Tax=Janthinobacterium sp. 17J80-10 TaxID=2497863 RepID=UPI00100560C1|nr:iron-containing alcohol dehydrogenase [Janthinobacterium sp. 17J80-10]QAU34222.1 iron-containing alcohol dehydrogenase [Janthinobacterium sp. 17J80-10]